MLLFAIQLTHTLLVLWLYACLCYMVYAHLTSRRSWILAVSYVSVALEGLAVVPLDVLCPLTLFVQDRYGPSVNDSLIPALLAQWVMPVGLSLFVLSLVAVPVRWLYLKRTTAL